jgi:1-acyl-sn-glycerol-3-phosphate acyltransferase
MISFKQNFAATWKLVGFRPSIWTAAALSPIVARRQAQRTQRRRSSTTSRRSTLSPGLADFAYALNQHCLLPTYFDRIQVTGQAHVPHSGPIIFAPTHRSRWDGLLLPYAIRAQGIRYPRYMVTIDEMQGLQGWFIRRLGGFPVDTRSPGVSSLRHGIDLLHQGQPLVIFPEGGQLLENRRVGVNRLHSGLARIAIKAYQTQPQCDVKIVPVAINYRDPRVGRCGVDIQIGAPLLVSDYLETKAKRSASRITEDLSVALRRLSHFPAPVMAGQ